MRMISMHLSKNCAVTVSRSGAGGCLLPGEGLGFWTGREHSMGGETELCQYIDYAYRHINPFCLYDCYA